MKRTYLRPPTAHPEPTTQHHQPHSNVGLNLPIRLRSAASLSSSSPILNALFMTGRRIVPAPRPQKRAECEECQTLAATPSATGPATTLLLELQCSNPARSDQARSTRRARTRRARPRQRGTKHRGTKHRGTKHRGTKHRGTKQRGTRQRGTRQRHRTSSVEPAPSDTLHSMSGIGRRTQSAVLRTGKRCRTRHRSRRGRPRTAVSWQRFLD
jgi:hypothetical protein